mgnify:FL=1
MDAQARLAVLSVFLALPAGCCFPVDERVQTALDGNLRDLRLVQVEVVPKLQDGEREKWALRLKAFIVRGAALSSWGRGESFDVDAAKAAEGIAP